MTDYDKIDAPYDPHEWDRREKARKALRREQFRNGGVWIKNKANEHIILILIIVVAFFVAYLISINSAWVNQKIEYVEETFSQSFDQLQNKFNETVGSDAVTSGVQPSGSASAALSASSLQSAERQVKTGESASEQSSVETPAEKEATKKDAIKRKVVVRGADGWLSIKHLNVAPYRPFRNDAKDRKILASRGYSGEEIDEYFSLINQDKCSKESFARGTEYLWMSYGNARVLDKLRATWGNPEKATVCQLASGRTVVIMQACDNLAEVPPRTPAPTPEPEKEVIPPPKAPEIVETPPEEPVQEEIPPVVPPVAETPPKKSDPCFFFPTAIVGAEHSRPGHGNRGDSKYASAAWYCGIRNKADNATHGFGIAGQGSWWTGKVDKGLGIYKGQFLAAGPSYAYITDKGTTTQATLLFGRMKQTFSQDAYQSDRSFDGFGPALSFSDYERRLAGKTWFNEYQLFGYAFFPLTERVSHSWQGSPIGDTKGLSEFNTLVSIGGRLWIHDNPFVHPYFQAGLFWENPGVKSGSFRIGIADPNHICGIGIGIDRSFTHRTNAKAWGWWCDPVAGFRTYRRAVRGAQTVAEIGNGASLENGMIMIPMDEPVGEEESQESNLNDGMTPRSAILADAAKPTETVLNEKVSGESAVPQANAPAVEAQTIGNVASVDMDANPEEAPGEPEAGVTSVDTIDTELPNSADSAHNDAPLDQSDVTTEPLLQ